MNAPISVAALPEGEVAVATLREPHLVIVFDKNGRDVREFGDPEPISERAGSESLPEYRAARDRRPGASLLRLCLSAGADRAPVRPQRLRAGKIFNTRRVDAWPAAQATRKEIERQEKQRRSPTFKRILTAVGVDRATGEVWMALGNTLLRFDKEGNRRASYKIYTPEGARLEANTILVDQTACIIGSDPLGIYEFDRPGQKNLNNRIEFSSGANLQCRFCARIGLRRRKIYA